MIAVIFLSSGLFAQSLASAEIDIPAYQGERPIRTALLFRALHYASGSRDAQSLHAGVYVEGRSLPDTDGSFLYEVEAALSARLVSAESEPDPAEKITNERVQFEPGRTLYGGLSLCSRGMCGFTIGRGSQGPDEIDVLTGSHGPRAGAALFLQGEHAFVRVLPWFLPTASGGGLDGTFAGRAVRFDGRGRGARAEAGVLFEYGGIAFHAEKVRQKQMTRKGLDAQDTLELAGAAFLLRKPDGFLRMHLLAGAEHASGRYAATTNDETGSPFARIDGSALRAQAALNAGVFYLRSDFFLPEPGSAPDGRRKSRETSGYVAYGNAISAADTLRSRPGQLFPELCEKDCSGLTASSESPHAGLFVFETGLQFDRISAAGELRVLRPLEPQEKTRGNPFRKTRKDPERTEYREGSLLLGYSTAGGDFRFRYSRLKGRKNGRVFFAAESAEIALLRHL